MLGSPRVILFNLKYSSISRHYVCWESFSRGSWEGGEEGGCTQTCTLKHTRVGVVGSERDIRALGEQDVGQSPAVAEGCPSEDPGT